MGLPEYLSGGRIQGRTDDSLATAVPFTAFKEIGRMKLSSAGNSIDVRGLNSATSGGFSTKQNIMVLYHGINTGSQAMQGKIQLGANDATPDSSGQYAYRHSRNGESDWTSGSSQDQLWYWVDGTAGGDEFGFAYIRNASGYEKLGYGHGMNDNGVDTTGTSGVPNRAELTGKWASTSQFNRLRVINTTSTIHFDTNSEVVILGCDDDEADNSTPNAVFWQELATDTLTAVGTTLDSGTFTAKKYLRFEIVKAGNSGGNANCTIRFNGEDATSGNNRYCKRQRGWNASNGTSEEEELGNESGIANPMGLGSSADTSFVESWCVNYDGKPKMGIIHNVDNTGTGDDDRPARFEGNWKWAETDQITRITATTTANNYAVGSTLRVWGHD